MCFTCEGLNQILLTEMPYINKKIERGSRIFSMNGVK